jgi:hypothetical protein
VIADVGAEHFQDVGLVAGCVMHQPFQAIYATKTDIEIFGAELIDGGAEAVSDLALFSKLLLVAILGVGNPKPQRDQQHREDASQSRHRLPPVRTSRASGPRLPRQHVSITPPKCWRCTRCNR